MEGMIMSEVIADVMLHIKEALELTVLDKIKQDLLNLDGVDDASFKNDTPHLMLVKYDSEVISGQAILSYVRQHGYNASLVGL